jgi:DNA mismatch repair protein MutL
MKIQILPDNLANQIAAGEVVERPASVVKELLENSIDAKSTRISIEIESGGKKLIKVSDNGVGMPHDDALLAFARHATSKIASSDELEAIKTLGFRGEALPSIGSVAQVRLTTCDDETDTGTEVIVEGSDVQRSKDIARPRGTTIEVERIFHNTPARKKFLKGDSAEASHITQVVTQQALAHPEIHFTLIHNGRKIIDTLPTDQKLYRIAELAGADLASHLIEVNEVSGEYRLEGFVSSPVYTRSSRNAQYSFVNNRFIRDKVLLGATQQGYSHLVPRGQHPALYLFLSMDPTLVDVNVHPAKAEVRFAFQSEVYRFISGSVREALRKNDKSSSSYENPINSPYKVERDDIPYDSIPPTNEDHKPGWQPQMVDGNRLNPSPTDSSNYFNQNSGRSIKDNCSVPDHGHAQIFNQKPIPLGDLIYSEFEVLGQLNNSFAILQGPQGIVVVDQHVAHERILYERFRSECHNKKIEIQTLLFPVTVEFSPEEAQLLGEHLDRLKELGLDLEIFGTNGFILRSVPAMLKDDNHTQLLREVMDSLPGGGGSDAVLTEKYEETVIMMSCRKAIKVNQSLHNDQIKKLLYDLEQTQMPYTCPHGRPIALLFPMDEILKKFLRK